MHFQLLFKAVPPQTILALAVSSYFTSQSAWAQTSGQVVEITGKPQATRERQDDIGLRSVYGREEIEKYGDTNISDVLKRLPGVSVGEGKGKGAEIRLRGLGNGYTQILLNGQATSPDFNIDSITPDLIEKIEIMRVNSADVSAQSIAGSINIVLKKKTSKQSNDIKTTVGLQAGRLSGNLAWSLADNAPARLGGISYVLAGSMEGNTTDINTTVAESIASLPQPGGQWQTQSARQLQQTQQNRRDAMTLAPRVNWKIDASNSLNWQGNVNYARQEQAKQEQEHDSIGTTTDFPINHSIFDAHLLTARNELEWERRLDDSAKLNIKLGWNHFDKSTKFQFWGNDNNANLTEVRYVTGSALANTYNMLGKYLAPFTDNHVISMGWEISRTSRTENRAERDITLTAAAVTDDVHNYEARLNKFAAYVQDEWNISKNWSSYLGLRWERVNTSSTEAGAFDIENRSGMISPILQTVWKQSEQAQWRLALNRSFKMPTVFNLIPRRLRIDNNNTPLNTDNQGNPNLLPERAWGLELAYEHYFSDASLFSTNLYWRKIDDVVMNQLTQSDGNWLTTPVNNGRAKVIGLEIEAKAKLQELSASLPPVELRATVNRNWSRLEQVPGPDNRLAEQPALLVSTGIDYQFHPVWRLGADYNFQAASNVRESLYLSSHSAPKRNLDMYLAWKQNPKSQLRFSVTNALQQDNSGTDIYATANARWSETDLQHSARTWRLVWEHQL